MIIAIDFDGTLCDHRFPEIGSEVTDAFVWLRKFQEAGAMLMLWTMRSGHTLTEAVEWCRERDIEFWGINNNPEQYKWSESPKQYANIYIDDTAFGCPLRDFPRFGSRPVVDWSIVGPKVLEILKGGTR